ncbi:MAG TPA: hypothetical protein VGP53_04815 [Acidimicrobiales bacterium]|nr:hypothetical protein [Acidimicrobiales bacterium]
MDAADEGRHRPPSPIPLGWSEWWSFDACAPDCSLGVFVRLALHPGRRRCSYWAGLVGRRRPYLLVRDDDLDLPPPSAGLEVRGSLWASCTCEQPGSHWTLGLESWGVTFDDRDLLDAWGHERGGRQGLALDLSFEDEPAAGGGACQLEEGWWRAGRLWGEIQVGSGGRIEELPVEAWPAVRRHCWGPSGPAEREAQGPSGPAEREAQSLPGGAAWSWGWSPSGVAVIHEHGGPLPRNRLGLPTADGDMEAIRWAPVLATEPVGWQVGRALTRSPSGDVGWLESWTPPGTT